jgi:hypothetical protein
MLRPACQTFVGDRAHAGAEGVSAGTPGELTPNAVAAGEFPLLALTNVGRLYPPVPSIDLPDDELAAVAAALRRVIEDDKYPHVPPLDPLKAALARLEAAVERAALEKSISGLKPVTFVPAKGDKLERR